LEPQHPEMHPGNFSLFLTYGPCVVCVLCNITRKNVLVLYMGP
jgi:hypothetical protein